MDLEDEYKEAKEQVLSRLAALDATRKQERERRKEDAAEKNAPNESIDEFLYHFSVTCTKFSNQLEAVKNDASDRGVSENTGPIQEQLDLLTAEVLQMEKKVADGSYFLPTFDQKQCTATLSDLKQRIQTVRAELLPKRKFAFNKKVSRVKGSDLSASAAVDSPLEATPVSAGGTSATRAGGDAQVINGVADPQGSVPTSLLLPSSTSWIPSPQDALLIQEGQGYMGLRNQVLVVNPQQVAGRDFVLIDLQDCQVYLMGHLPALRMTGLSRTTVVAGPVTGSCFVVGATHCKISLASYQVRIHSSSETDFYLRSRSKPIIEHSSKLRFAPLLLECDSGAVGVEAPCGHDGEVKSLLTQHRLGEETRMFEQVEDFGWIKSSHSPNWSILAVEGRHQPVTIPWSDSCEGAK
ncbi:hypothetical protein CEUSTIGMA_g8931.t1 [Chlamydomonas eustigma]|uniref:C-CAP/cofactor C-like domain-containing protein n=1 Tax=Chlamydomonas eustigma TaxID=1157962 RepID=A0A250XEK9_9CHLO|nr:hypothetical protein CEUSTIGMA_g8931.t1 [Chlamydomonas eustigma]|eukprot:GAX81503.1 hypothetical protein CEUSTIGMA_g8931.t1 [Chlamydomonas eustigma]